MTVLEEAAKRVAQRKELAGRHARVKLDAAPRRVGQQRDGARVVSHDGAQTVEVRECDEQQRLRARAGQHLQLDAHGHEVKELVHRGLVEAHDAAVRDAVEDLARCAHAVGLLRPEELVDEVWLEDGRHDVDENLAALARVYGLCAQPLLEDVQHLDAEVDDEERHGRQVAPQGGGRGGCRHPLRLLELD